MLFDLVAVPQKLLIKSMRLAMCSSIFAMCSSMEFSTMVRRGKKALLTAVGSANSTSANATLTAPSVWMLATRTDEAAAPSFGSMNTDTNSSSGMGSSGGRLTLSSLLACCVVVVAPGVWSCTQ